MNTVTEEHSAFAESPGHRTSPETIDIKLAIVHDALGEAGGAENVLAVLHRMYPTAPVFTPVLCAEGLPKAFLGMDVRTSFMQRLPWRGEHHRKYVALCPAAMESFDLTGFDVVLSSSRGFAKGVRIPPGTLHVCYCYTPNRIVWDREASLREHGIRPAWRPLLARKLERLKTWDLRTAEGVHHFVATAEFVARRIAAAYRREAAVIYPPVETARFFVSPAPEDYFLVVSRLSPGKNVDIVIDALNRTPHRLLIAGTGPVEPLLRRRAGKNVSFLGRVSDEELPALMSRCRALISAAGESLGIALMEAMAAGRPVIALRRGLAEEIVVEGETGVLFGAPTPDSLLLALQRFAAMRFDPQTIRAQALNFDTSVFVDRLDRFIRGRLMEFRAGPMRFNLEHR
jgi:glycosyltransferase involved in cell wall biosynthesis